MVVRANAEESAFEGATASFMRSMLGIDGRWLANLAGDGRPSETLRYLCDSARDLLGADDVAVRLYEGAIGLSGLVESGPGVLGREVVVPQLIADVGNPADGPLGQLEFWWADSERQPTPLDELVATRFATMALLVLERHMGKRRQLQAIAQERESTAGEIHDDPIQVMTAVSLQLQRTASRLADGEDRAAIQQARALNDDAIDRLRHVIFSLHPATLAEDGLTASIEAYCESYVEPEGLAWKVTGFSDDEVPLELGALAFRLCRNALVNVVEHAQASAVVIDVSSIDGLLQVEVRDDGIGFDLAQVRHTRVGHVGIPHAVTLARWAAGTYTTVSTPGQGTTVTVKLPIL